MPDKAIAKALKDQGVKMPGSATRSPSAADKARSLNAKVESAARRRVFDALRPKIGEALQVEDWRAIAAQVWEDHGYRDVRLIADLWAPTATAAKRTDGDRLEDIKKRVAKMETPELGRFMVDVVLAGELDVSPFGSAHDDSPLFDFAKRYGVDVAKLRASAKAQLAPAPKKSEKKKPSAKKKAKALAAKKAKP